MKMRSIAPMKIAKIGYIVVSGTIVLFHPKNVMAFISTAFGIAILFDGLFKIRTALDSKRFGIKDW